VASHTENLDIRKPEGTYVVRQVFRAAFFLRRPHLEINRAVVNAFHVLLDSEIGESLAFVAGATGDWFQQKTADLRAAVEASLVDQRRTINGTISMSSDPSLGVPAYYVEYNGFALDRPLFKDRACFMFLWCPADRFMKNPTYVRTFVWEMARGLPVSCMHADLALVGNQMRRQQLARRYVGIDISDISATAIDMDDKASGAYWMTVYGDDLARRLGSVSEIRRALHETSQINDTSTYIGILLSDLPSLGDRNRRESLPGHVALSNLLNQKGILHIPRRTVYFEDEGEREDAELQTMWHRRFLGEEW
jgi:hypothetical protein